MQAYDACDDRGAAGQGLSDPDGPERLPGKQKLENPADDTNADDHEGDVVEVGRFIVRAHRVSPSPKNVGQSFRD